MASHFGFIFQKDAVEKYKLTPTECVILDWFHWFMQSGKQSYIERADGFYYWISYEKVFSDLGSVLPFRNIKTLATVFKNLSRKGVLEKFDSGDGKVRKLFFRFNYMALDELRNGVKDMILDPFGLAQDIDPGKVNRNVVTILQELSELRISALNKNLFSYRMTMGAVKITKAIENFNTKILHIYAGKFTKSVYPLSVDFLQKNRSTIIGDDNYNKIRSCKGNWEAVKKLIIHSAKNYLLWFSSTRAPFNKGWLTRDINTWMYDERNESSFFLACVLKEPETITSKLSSDVIEKLPFDIYEESVDFRKEFFPRINERDMDLFWFNINKVWKVERKLKIKYRDNYMVSLWLEDFTTNYLKYMKTCYGNETKKYLTIRAIGPNGNPWKKWMESDQDLSDFHEELFADSKV